MAPKMILTPLFLPLDAVRLGRLVLDIDEPEQDFHDPPEAPGSEIHLPSPSSREDFETTIRSKVEEGFAAKLTQLVSASRTKSSKTATQVSTDLIQRYKLYNSGLFYKKAITSEDTRNFITQAANSGDSVFLVVGFYTMSGARVVEGVASTSDWSAQAQVPVDKILAAAAGVPPPIGAMANDELEAHRQQFQAVQESYVVPDEQVCAVQYRKIKFNRLWSRDLDSTALEKGSCWRTTGVLRDGQPQRGPDMLDVEELEDDLGVEDKYNRYEIGDDCVLWRRMS